VDEHNLSFIAVTENTTGKTAKAVIDNTKDKNQQIVVIDSMQAVSEKDMENGVTYLGTMKKNLDAIKMLLETE
jgi:zinc transport system substrate-binding protein